jgi:hypothetical protein
MAELLTVEQVAAILQVSPDTVTRRFAKVKGVVDLGSPETPRKRRYRVLRIPRVVVERYVLEHGGRITVPDVPAKPAGSKRVPKDLPHEDDLIRDLALVASQHGPDAQKTLDRIARRARLLKFVPKDQWSDLVWFDEEEE